MTQEKFDLEVNKLRQKSEDIAKAKRPGYTGDSTDVLHNFKSSAKTLGLTPMQVWAVLFMKHIAAITSYAKNPNIPQAEELEGRFCDTLNYLELGYAVMLDGIAEDTIGSNLQLPPTPGKKTW